MCPRLRVRDTLFYIPDNRRQFFRRGGQQLVLDVMDALSLGEVDAPLPPTRLLGQRMFTVDGLGVGIRSSAVDLLMVAVKLDRLLLRVQHVILELHGCSIIKGVVEK